MNTKTRSYKDLVVWQKGIELAKLVYKLTQNFPSEEKGSVAELDTQLICEKGAADPAFALIGELRKMHNVLRQRLAERP